MFETLESPTETPFSAAALALSDPSQAETEPAIGELLGTIETLQLALNHKEQALVQSALTAAGFQQQCEKTKTQNDVLRKKLTTAVKANESLTQKVSAAEEQVSTQGRNVPEAEVARMKEQWRAAQKSFEREYARLRAELAKASAGLHQSGQELEAQSRARRAEAAHASLRIANLEREAATARAVISKSGVPVPAARMSLRLSATSAATAALVLALGFWWQVSHTPARHAAPPQIAAVPAVSPRIPVSTLSAGLSNMTASGGAFRKALNRLNNSLYGPIGVSPEQILRYVREGNPKVCNFQWNNGQPALYFSGAQSSLESSLDSCATAVDRFLRNPIMKPTQVLTSKK